MEAWRAFGAICRHFSAQIGHQRIALLRQSLIGDLLRGEGFQLLGHRVGKRAVLVVARQCRQRIEIDADGEEDVARNRQAPQRLSLDLTKALAAATPTETGSTGVFVGRG